MFRVFDRHPCVRAVRLGSTAVNSVSICQGSSGDGSSTGWCRFIFHAWRNAASKAFILAFENLGNQVGVKKKYPEFSRGSQAHFFFLMKLSVSISSPVVSRVVGPLCAPLWV